MSGYDALDTLLQRLMDSLRAIKNPKADRVAALLAQWPEDRESVMDQLNGNDFWAGAGSLAAETMMDNPGWDPSTWQYTIADLRDTLISIGEMLMQRGKENPGISSWILAFKNWQRAGF